MDFNLYFLFKIYLVLKNFNDDVEKCIMKSGYLIPIGFESKCYYSSQLITNNLLKEKNIIFIFPIRVRLSITGFFMGEFFLKLLINLLE